MKKTILKVLKYIIIGVSVYLAVLITEFCCIYAVKGESTWSFIKETWEWYSTLF